MHKIKLLKNTIASFIFQITTIICGFILPRLILQQYGSEVNGLVNSLNQFLGIIAFLELGVGAVIQSTLYKPLAKNDEVEVSKIVVSGDIFFKKIARILLLYIIILIFIYPFLSKNDFSWLYTTTLIIAISVSSFAQYYFGVVDRLLLTADQRGYIQYNAQTITLVANTGICALLIKFGASIQMVKLVTSCIYLLRPLYLRIYINKKYNIDRSIILKEEPIKQKWNGVAQHVAAFVLDNTDSIVLTIFSTLSNVSIYAVYHFVIFGVKQLFLSMTNGIQALMGELWAKKKLEELNVLFGNIEWLIHTGTVFIFGCTGMLIVPFVQVYTLGVNDANYIQPLFGIILTIAHAGHCLRLPYNLMILAGGHYKQTQKYYIIAAIINITISVTTVKIWGLVGVAIGTMAATFFHTIWMAIYVSKNLINWKLYNFIKQVLIDIFTVIVAVFCTKMFKLNDVSYMGWLILAMKVSAIWGIVLLLVNFIFCRKRILNFIRKLYMSF